MAEPVSSIDYWQQRGHEKECPDCDGTGTHTVWGNSQFTPVVDFDCRTCKGKGVVKVSELDQG